MSGHSKWATIHRQKEVVDAKRGQAFTKLANAIIVAVRAGGGMTDPNSNFKLRLAIEKARQFNMPKENIQRAIERGSGEGGVGKWEEVVYEGYGPGGIAVMIEAATDNRQRTAQEIKNLMEKRGGNLAGPGSVAFQFARKGLLTVGKPASVEEAVLAIMDLEGVEDVEEAQDVIEVYAQAENLETLKKRIQEAGFSVLGFEVIMRPISTVPITGPETAKKVIEFMRKIEEQDDVQKVYSNFDIPQELVDQLANP